MTGFSDRQKNAIVAAARAVIHGEPGALRQLKYAVTRAEQLVAAERQRWRRRRQSYIDKYGAVDGRRLFRMRYYVRVARPRRHK